MDWIQLTGHVGAFLSSITFIPQVYKVFKTKSVEDLSLTMMLIVSASTLIWSVYGIALILWPVILANGFIFCLSLLMIYLKFAYAKK
jgi:MtN3 and saliva related transmembrane protein